jgi:hypothetical protein
LGVLEVAKDIWPLQVLRLLLGAGEVVYEVAESELLVRLHELGTKAGNQWTFPPTPFSLLRGAFLIDITAAVQTLWWIQADIPRFVSEPLPASLLSVTESGQQKGAGR